MQRRHNARRRALRLRRAALALVSIAVVWSFAALLQHRQRAHQATSAAPIALRLADPIPYSSTYLSAGARWTPAQARRLAAFVREAINGFPFPAQSALVLLDPRSGTTLYRHKERAALAPASTIKLVVAAAALRYLGARYRFVTTLASDGRVRGDTLDGNLWLVGSGDPELLSDDLRAAARNLVSSGIRHIGGAVYADGTAFGPESVNRTWLPDDLQYGFAAPPSAVTIGGGTAQFTITPTAVGDAASVSIDPPSTAGPLAGSIRTTYAGAPNSVRIDPLLRGGFGLYGAIPSGAPQKYWRSLRRPTLSAALAMRTLLQQQGVQVSGMAGMGKAPDKVQVLWRHTSRPLLEIVKHMAYDSDNHIAEQCLRSIGRQLYGVGTLANGVAAERRFLKSIDAWDDRIVLADGSGLSTSDRITAGSLAAILRWMVSGPDAERVAHLLPRVGLDGTTRWRSIAADARGKVLGKDGYIEGASGLAGYVETAHHGVLVYAFLVDDWRFGLYNVWRAEDEMLARLSRL